MLEFTKDIKEAGLIFEDYGYLVNANPRMFGKEIQTLFRGLKNGHLHNFPAKNLNPNVNILINHLLSKTLAIDIDDYIRSKILFNSLGFDLDKIMSETVVIEGQPNHYKLLYANNTNITLNEESITTVETLEIFAFKGAIMTDEVRFENVSNYFDLLPPSHLIPYNTKMPVPPREYKFVTPLVRRSDLPEMPKELLEVWYNFSSYKSELLSKVV